MVAPMLATLGPLPEGPEWSYEFKWDGVRAVIAVGSGLVQAISRNNLDFTASYPELAALPDQLGHHDLVLDGVMSAEGVSRCLVSRGGWKDLPAGDAVRMILESWALIGCGKAAFSARCSRRPRAGRRR